MFVTESQFSCCMYNSQLVNTDHTERTITIVLPSVGCYGTLTDVLDSRERNLVPLVLHLRISKVCDDLTVQRKYLDPHK